MTTKKYVVLLSIILCMIGTKALASDITVEIADGVYIWYIYNNDGKELMVSSVSRDITGSLVIPEEVTYMNRTRKVTGIARSAFSDRSGLTSIIIPNSVVYIGESAFSGCSGLKSVTIPNSVTYIGKSAFYNCRALTSIAIPNSMTYIREGIFNKCVGLTSVTIPNSVTSIGDQAFRDCNLKSVTIPNSVTSIGKYAFYGSILTSVTIPNSVTSIGDWAFAHCDFTSVTIPNSVTSIGKYAFYNCRDLTSITIPNSVTYIGENAFYGWYIAEVVSKIENPSSILTNIFTNETFYNATLYVPAGAVDKYKITGGWKKFVFIEEGTGSDNPIREPKKCEKPTISCQNGKLSLSCVTEGVTYQYNITASSVKSGAGNDIDFTPKYTISVYATKDGYVNSETATLEVSIGDANCDGIINAADITTIVNIIMEQ